MDWKHTVPDSGVYWCSRDMAPGPIGNHHFFIFVYQDEAEARRVTQRWQRWNIGYHRETNDDGQNIFFTTMGVGEDDNGNIVFNFNPESDLWAVNEIVKEANTDALSPDWDLQGSYISHLDSMTNFPSYEALMNAILERIFNFKEQSEIGNVVGYDITDENCAAGLNSILACLGFPADYRETMGEFWGVDWGEEDIIPATYFTMTYVGNSSTLEVHSPGCAYASLITARHRVQFNSIFDALAQGYNGCYYCMREFDTDSAVYPVHFYRLHLISLICNETEDITGGDSAYLRVNGQRVWGPISMNNGFVENLSNVPPVEFADVARVELFDKDTGASINLYIGSLSLDSDDLLGSYNIPGGLAGEGIRAVNFTADGANYTLLYQVVEYDVNTGEELPLANYRLLFDSLTCYTTEDWTGPDETYLRANNLIVWGPHSMNDGQTEVLTALMPIQFQGSVRLDLYDQDGTNPADDDDHLGYVLVTSSCSGLGQQTHVFNGDESNYLLRYHVEQQ
jgi:hypothetical protein